MRTRMPKALRRVMTPRRYGELLAFCRGYREYGAEAAARERAAGALPEGLEKERLLWQAGGLRSDLRMIERAARESSGGAWQEALIRHCCQGVPYDVLKMTPGLLPSNAEKTFLRAKVDFFARLDRAQRARNWKGAEDDLVF